MREGLFIVVITSPDTYPAEAERITGILREGEADVVHIRKPGRDADMIRRLIEEIPSDLRGRLKVHDHFELAAEMGLMGVHLNSRCPTAPEGVTSVSRSMHSVEQLVTAEHYDYVTLSPVFDSISKAGYRSAFDLEEIAPHIKGKRVVALGGVTPDKFPLLREAGFYGAAMLGHFWNR